MKILMIHQHFKTPQTGGAIRSYYLAKALVDHGHRVVMITSFNERKFRSVSIEGIEILYLPIPYDNRFQFYARVRAFIMFIIKACILAAKFKEFDRCYTISVPLTVGVIARWIYFRYDIPYIFEVGDLWPDAPIQIGFVRNRFLQKALYALERSTYRRAMSLVALSPAIQSSINLKVPGKEIHLIPNMADGEFYHPVLKAPELESKFSVRNKFVVTYAGAMGVANGLDHLLQCAQAAEDSRLPIHFILCGDGSMQVSLKSSARQLGIKNISFIDFVNREGVGEIMNVSDAIFVSYADVPILETGSPNKFFDGLAAGKLIIINFGGWLRKEIEENQCGIFVDPHQPSDFVKRISPFVSDRELLQQYQSAARQLGERKYSRKLLTETFSRLFA